MGLRRVDPADVPASARTAAAGPSQQKRKAEFQLAQLSQPSTPRAGSSRVRATQAGPTATQIAEDEVEEVVPEESIDELYVMLRSNVVGVQYYQGVSSCSSCCSLRLRTFLTASVQVWSVLAKK